MAQVTPLDVTKKYIEVAGKAAFKKLRKKAIGDAKEWKWATGPMIPPYGSQKHGPIEWVDKKEKGETIRHGLDSTGKIRFCSRFDLDSSNSQGIFIYEKGGFWLFETSHRGDDKICDVTWFEMDKDRLIRQVSISDIDTEEIVFHYHGKKLTKSVEQSWDVSIDEAKKATAADFKAEQHCRSEYLYSYEKSGELASVVWHRNYLKNNKKFSEVVFSRKPKKSPKQRPLKTVLADSEKLMVKEITKAIKSAGLTGWYVSLIVQFTGTETDDGGFVPPLYLVSEDLRNQFVENRDVYSSWCIPYLDRKAEELNIESKKLDSLLDEAARITWSDKNKQGYTPTRKMFQRVCKQLNAKSWRRSLKTTPDFVVVPCDSHDEFEKEEDFRACIGKRKFSKFVDAGNFE